MLPALEMPPCLALPPLLFCRGVSPSADERCRAEVKLEASPIVATSRSAVGRTAHSSLRAYRSCADTRQARRQGSAVPAAPTARRSRRWGSRCTLADTFLCVRPSTSHATAEPLVRVVNNAQSSRSKRFWVRLLACAGCNGSLSGAERQAAK